MKLNQYPTTESQLTPVSYVYYNETKVLGFLTQLSLYAGYPWIGVYPKYQSVFSIWQENSPELCHKIYSLIIIELS